MDYLLFLSNSLDHFDNNRDPIFVSFHNTKVKSISEQFLMLFFPFYWSACKDLSPSCPSWAEQGECGKNPSYMLDNCCRSCRK